MLAPATIPPDAWPLVGGLSVRRYLRFPEAGLPPALRDIYEEAFRPAERYSADAICARLEGTWRPGVHFELLELLAENKTVGLALWAYLPNYYNVGYLPQMAIQADQRGRGYGALLMATMLGDMRAQARAAGRPDIRLCFWEVCDPAHAENVQERRYRERVVGFYRAQGAHFTPITYSCPPMGPDLPRVTYNLMVRIPSAQPPLRRADAERLVRAGLIEMNGDDPTGPYLPEALARLQAVYPN